MNLAAHLLDARLADGSGERVAIRTDADSWTYHDVVRRSFEFLLEREPASSILSRLSLDDISRYPPEYERELARRLG